MMYQITLNESQLSTLEQSLEIATRIHLNQVGIALSLVETPAMLAKCDNNRIRLLTRELEVELNACSDLCGRGVGSKDARPNHLAAYDMLQVARNRLWKDRNGAESRIHNVCSDVCRMDGTNSLIEIEPITEAKNES